MLSKTEELEHRIQELETRIQRNERLLLDLQGMVTQLKSVLETTLEQLKKGMK